MKRIITRSDFIALAGDLGVREDWHEPDEQEVTAVVRGADFDNAGFWPSGHNGIPREFVETHVVFRKGGEDIACANLATLCAWAAGLEE